MLGDAIKQTTTTTGTGNLTLAAVTNSPKISDAVPVGFPMAYALRDSSNTLLETGIGHMSDATTFVRQIVCATYITGTYSGGPSSAAAPSAVSLSGTTTLIVTPHAATVESMLATVDNQSASVNRYLSSAHRNMSVAATGPATNATQYTPFLLRCAAPISSLAVYLSTVGAAGDKARMAIYASNEKGYMGPQLFTSGDVDISSTAGTGLKVATITTPLMLPPGWYITGFIASSGTPRLNGYSSNAANQYGGSPFGFNSTMAGIEWRSEAVGSVLMPSTPSATTSAQTLGGTSPVIVYLGTV